MISWLALRLVKRTIGRTNNGDIRPALRMFHENGMEIFPGTSSWGRTYRGRREVEGFLQRFVDSGLKLEPYDAVAKGWPWNMTVCVLFIDHLTTPEGERIYENRGCLYVTLRWGKIVRQEDFLDTEKVAKLDELLAARDELPATPRSSP